MEVSVVRCYIGGWSEEKTCVRGIFEDGRFFGR